MPLCVSTTLSISATAFQRESENIFADRHIGTNVYPTVISLTAIYYYIVVRNKEEEIAEAPPVLQALLWRNYPAGVAQAKTGGALQIEKLWRCTLREFESVICQNSNSK